MPYFAGLDWASAAHALCVIDESGSIIDTFSVEHSVSGLSALLRRLAHVASPSELEIAIERPSGLLVDTLLAGGHRVVPVHPNILKATRSRYSMAGGKSDPADAFILADLLRTYGHRFRRLQPLSDQIRALRALVRSREDLLAHRIRLANQLRSLLESFWPGAAAIFTDIDSPISLAFLARYPSPTSAHRLGEQRLAAFLKRERYSGRRSVAELLDRLRLAPKGLAPAAEGRAKAEIVRALVATLRPVVREIHRLNDHIEQAVEDHPLGRVVLSFPRAAGITAAKVVAEMGEDTNRFASPEPLASEAGVAPITRTSGKHRCVSFRWACNKRLRQALVGFADNSRHGSAWAEHVYSQARARGCRHPNAVRILARAWVRVLWHCWREHTLYDPARHHAAHALVAV